MQRMISEPKITCTGDTIEEIRYNKALAAVSNSAHKYSELPEEFQKDPKIMKAALSGYDKIVKSADNMLMFLPSTDKNYMWAVSEKVVAYNMLTFLAETLGVDLTKKDSGIQM